MRSLLGLAAAAAAPAAMLAVLPLAALAPVAGAIRIIQSNDDGWAELHVRTSNDVLRAENHSVLLSAPADDRSGTGSDDAEPVARDQPCHYGSCPAGSGAVGYNATRPDLRWVNSYPVTAMRHAIDKVAPRFWGRHARPELAVVGPNAGPNLWFISLRSGTVGAAVRAVQSGIPAIAFSVDSFEKSPWNIDTNASSDAHALWRSKLYAKLALYLTDKLIASGKPYLPDGVYLNVNIQSADGACVDLGRYKWVLSLIGLGIASPPDVDWCGTRRLPPEFDVMQYTDGCYVSVSVGDASDKTTVNDGRQGVCWTRSATCFHVEPRTNSFSCFFEILVPIKPRESNLAHC